jgi:uncharacterized protein DUF4406
MTVYISGPMRGYHHFNFAAFDEARDTLARWGWEKVVSPADHDREMGFDGTDSAAYHESFPLGDALKWDIEQVFAVDALYMLIGWETSTGARAEHAVAVALGKMILYQ